MGVWTPNLPKSSRSGAQPPAQLAFCHQTSTVWFYRVSARKPAWSGPSGSHLEVGLAVFPPLGLDFEEEEEEHEDQAGAHVKDYTQTHVNAVKAQTQNPNATPRTTSILFEDLVSGCWLLLKLQVQLLILSLPPPLRWVKWCRVIVGGRLISWNYGVFGGQIGGSVVLPQEHKHMITIPDVDTVLLLVTRGAEGGARPWSLREEGVIA